MARRMLAKMSGNVQGHDRGIDQKNALERFGNMNPESARGNAREHGRENAREHDRKNIRDNVPETDRENDLGKLRGTLL